MCSIDNCRRPAVARGWCKLHYYRFKRCGDPLVTKRTAPGTFSCCAVDGCERPYYGAGYCNMHWQRNRSLGAPGDASPKKVEKGAVPQWIADHVEFDGHECLIWPFSRNDNGYPRGHEYPLHAMCEAAHGRCPPDKTEVAHSCGKGHLGCIHPGHLRWATTTDNMWDKEAHGTLLWGEKIACAKLTVAAVKEIRSSNEPIKALAEKYGVDPATLRKAKDGQTWRRVS